MDILSFDTNFLPKVRYFGKINYDSPWIHFPRIIDEYILYIILSGELYIKEGDNKYHLKKHNMLLLEPNVEHVGYKKSCCHYYYIHFRHPKIRSISKASKGNILSEMIRQRKLSLTSDIYSNCVLLNPKTYFPKFYDIKQAEDIFSILSEANNDFYNKYEFYKKFTSLKLMEVLIMISREFLSIEMNKRNIYSSKSYIKSKKILNYLNTNFHQKITSKDIEKLFEASYDYLNRSFKKLAGHSIMQYLNIVRINNAIDIMASSPLKFSEISYLVGINDPYYFSKLFKKITGMSPTAYQKMKNVNELLSQMPKLKISVGESNGPKIGKESLPPTKVDSSK